MCGVSAFINGSNISPPQCAYFGTLVCPRPHQWNRPLFSVQLAYCTGYERRNAHAAQYPRTWECHNGTLLNSDCNHKIPLCFQKSKSHSSSEPNKNSQALEPKFNEMRFFLLNLLCESAAHQQVRFLFFCIPVASSCMACTFWVCRSEWAARRCTSIHFWDNTTSLR